MPFSQYRALLQSGDPLPRTARGYDNELLFWDRLREISDIADRYGIEDNTLRNSVISAGPCPGSWRVYYAAVGHGEKYEKVALTTYLGNQLRRGITTHDLGNAFERWVDEANQKFNSFISTGNLAVLNTISGVLGDYYRQESTVLLNGTTQDERESYIMEVSPKMQLSLRPPVRVNPDGLFPYGRFGAVFESKLSEPKHPEFIHQSAICALASEKVRQIDVNYAIVLHSSYPNGQITPWFREIPDSSIERVTSNLESFLHLLQYSEIQRNNSQGQSTLPSWKEFVARPVGLPESDLRAPCPKCPYKENCYEQGGEPRGWVTKSRILGFLKRILRPFFGQRAKV